MIAIESKKLYNIYQVAKCSKIEEKGNNRMDLNYFKDKLFDLLNDSEGLKIADLNADEQNNLLTVKTEDGNIFEISFRQVETEEP